MVSRLFNVGSCLLGAGLTAVFSLSLAQAQTVPYAPTYANAVPVSSTYSHAYPAVTYANNQYVVSAPVAQAYMAPSSVYAVAPTPTPCGVYGDYQSYLNQLIYYSHSTNLVAGDCATGDAYAYATPSVAGVSGYAPVYAQGTGQLPQAGTVTSGHYLPQTTGLVFHKAAPAHDTLIAKEASSQSAANSAYAPSQNNGGVAVEVIETSIKEEVTTAIAPQRGFRTSANVALELGYQAQQDIQPITTDLNFEGFSSIVIDRRNGTYNAQTLVEDTTNSLAKAYLNASAPTDGPFVAEASLTDQQGNNLEVYVDPYQANLPVTTVSNNSLVANGSVSVSGEYYTPNWAAGATVGVDVSPIVQQQLPQLSTANVYLKSKYGTVTAGYGVGLPYSTRSYEVISGGGYSSADYGDYQVGYVSPVIGNTRIGLVAGLQTRQLGATAEFQITRENNQFRAAVYADTAQTLQGELGYTRALGNQRFVGGTVYAGRDNSGEAFYGIQGNVDIGRHSVQANATRVKSNNLTIVYGSAATDAPVLGLDISDDDSFNQQDQLNLEYRYQATSNVQLYANAELVNHKYYGSGYGLGGGIRAAF